MIKREVEQGSSASLFFIFYPKEDGHMEFICGALAALCAVMAVMLVRGGRKPPEESGEKTESEGEKEIVWEVTKTARPTREQQYINMLMYNGENQTEGRK